jgi:hypothetical protein
MSVSMKLFAAFVLWTVAAGFPALAETKEIWHIGKFDESPVEFSAAAKGPVTFDAGADDAAKDWPRSQMIGKPSTITFSLGSTNGVYRLEIGALIEQPRIPAVQLTINGHRGIFYLHPKLSYSRSDFSYAFDPHESQCLLEIEIPQTYLAAGKNTIEIDTRDDPESPADATISHISYDALRLTHDASAKFNKQKIAAELQPTIFYRSGSGGLSEAIDGFVRLSGPGEGLSAELEIQGRRYSTQIPSIREFGEARFSFDVPEWTGSISGKLAIKGGKRKMFPVTLTAARKWTIFVVPHTHLDVGYTDYQGKVAEVQPRVLGQAAALIREHPDFRFSMDGSWNLQQLLNTRPKAARDQIIDLIRNRKMAMPAQYCNLLTGYASLETLYRSLYFSNKLAGEYGLPFEYANITDVPTYSGSYPSVLAASGIKYWVAAANNDRAPIFFYDHWNEKSPFWWEGPDGKKVLFWYSRHYMQVQTLFSLPPRLEAVRESLPVYLQAYSKPGYKPDVALIYGTQVENTDLFPSTATFADNWNKSYAYPRLRYATFPDFFHYVEEHFGKDLPTYKGDGGGYWEDGIGSDAYFAAMDRRNQHRALSAEVLSTLTHSLDANLNPPVGLFDDIWRNIILFAEHTWASYNSVSQPDHDETVKQLRVKDDRAERATLEIDDVMNRSLSQLADRIHVPSNTLVVFNSLNWRRDIPVEVDLLEHPTLTDLTTQKDVPLQVLEKKQRFLRVRFLAKGLPAVGYKCFRITYGEQGGPIEQMTRGRMVENRFYRVEADPQSGAVTTIYDKQLGRDIVDHRSPYQFGEYLYVTGGDGDTQMINPFPALRPGKLDVHPTSKANIVGVEHLPWGESLRTVSSDVNTPRIETEILLYNDEKKIQFRYRVHKDYTTAKEAVYFAFPAAVSQPDFLYANQQGWIDPAHDLMKGGSLEWFNVQNWMAVHDSNLAVGIVPLDAPLASFGDINRGMWPGEFKPKTGTIFSYAMNNYWHTNYRAGQSGDFTFRFTVTSGRTLDGASLSKLGMEEMRPAEVDYVVGQDKVGNPERPLPPEGASFLDDTGKDIALITWKRAENGDGTVARLLNLTGRETTAELHFPRLQISSAHLCSGVEENTSQLAVEDNTVKLSFRPFEVVTMRLTER